MLRYVGHSHWTEEVRIGTPVLFGTSPCAHQLPCVPVLFSWWLSLLASNVSTLRIRSAIAFYFLSPANCFWWFRYDSLRFLLRFFKIVYIILLLYTTYLLCFIISCRNKCIIATHTQVSCLVVRYREVMGSCGWNEEYFIDRFTLRCDLISGD